MTRRFSVDDREAFSSEQGRLVRTVVTRTGDTYSQRCSPASFEAVARYVESHAADGVTTPMLWEALAEVPCTQASVAVAFLKERGCLVVRHRRMFPASDCFFEDALVEFHALAEEPSEPAREAQAAQREGAWRQAAGLWRRAAETCDEPQRAWYEKQAAWCLDMARLTGDEAGQP
jgi:hypothetical protein